MFSRASNISDSPVSQLNRWRWSTTNSFTIKSAYYIFIHREVWMVSIRSFEVLLYWGSSNIDLMGSSWQPKYKINIKKERTSGHGSIFVLCAHMDHYDNFRASFLPCDFANYDWYLLLTCFVTGMSSSMNMDRWLMAECEVCHTSIVLNACA